MTTRINLYCAVCPRYTRDYYWCDKCTRYYCDAHIVTHLSSKICLRCKNEKCIEEFGDNYYISRICKSCYRNNKKMVTDQLDSRVISNKIMAPNINIANNFDCT